MSSELFEFSSLKKEYLKYRKLFPDAKEYAWTWDFLYNESEKRLKNFIEKDIDGIITSKPEIVNSLTLEK